MVPKSVTKFVFVFRKNIVTRHKICHASIAKSVRLGLKIHRKICHSRHRKSTQLRRVPYHWQQERWKKITPKHAATARFPKNVRTSLWTSGLLGSYLQHQRGSIPGAVLPGTGSKPSASDTFMSCIQASFGCVSERAISQHLHQQVSVLHGVRA